MSAKSNTKPPTRRAEESTAFLADWVRCRRCQARSTTAPRCMELFMVAWCLFHNLYFSVYFPQGWHLFFISENIQDKFGLLSSCIQQFALNTDFFWLVIVIASDQDWTYYFSKTIGMFLVPRMNTLASNKLFHSEHLENISNFRQLTAQLFMDHFW